MEEKLQENGCPKIEWILRLIQGPIYRLMEEEDLAKMTRQWAINDKEMSHQWQGNESGLSIKINLWSNFLICWRSRFSTSFNCIKLLLIACIFIWALKKTYNITINIIKYHFLKISIKSIKINMILKIQYEYNVTLSTSPHLNFCLSSSKIDKTNKKSVIESTNFLISTNSIIFFSWLAIRMPTSQTKPSKCN